MTVLLLAGCSSDGSASDEASPEQVLAQAKKSLDETSGVHLRLETPGLPEDVSGVVEADGIANHQPAFEGEIDLVYSGFTGTVPVTSVDGVVWAVLPFTKAYVQVDPAEYGAPDPAALMDPDSGVSAWLTAATDVEEGKAVRDGADVLSSYEGVLAGTAVAATIPSADETDEFATTFSIDEDGRLRTASLTGAFYKGKPELTYEVTLTEYGTAKDITKP
jgi:lipoprotein LprG